MEEVKYIPGDLVIHYGVKSVIDIVSCSQKRDDVCYGLHHLDGNNTSYQSFKKGQLVPIPLTPQILENNGWKINIVKDKNFWDRFSTEEEIQKGSFVDNTIARIAVKDKIVLMFWGSSPKVFIFELSHMVIRIEYCHQLQNLLFGLQMPMDLKV